MVAERIVKECVRRKKTNLGTVPRVAQKNIKHRVTSRYNSCVVQFIFLFRRGEELQIVRNNVYSRHSDFSNHVEHEKLPQKVSQSCHGKASRWILLFICKRIIWFSFSDNCREKFQFYLIYTGKTLAQTTKLNSNCFASTCIKFGELISQASLISSVDFKYHFPQC